MNEDILSFIWRFQYFNSSALVTNSGEQLTILHPGIQNRDAGPDFSNARVDIEGITWAGTIEIHVNSSDWHKHQHTFNKNYESVILHVVWNDDMPVIRHDGTTMPTLVLNGIVRQSILQRYHHLHDSPDPMPCASQFADIETIFKVSMLDRVLLERIRKKADLVLDTMRSNSGDWEETAYQWVGQHFGFKLNDPAFLRLCHLTPWSTIRKLRSDRKQLEAMLFGNAGLIPIETDDLYTAGLKEKYHYLKQKFDIKVVMHAHEWKFLRLRPAGFPTVRLSQFAHFLQKTGNIFSDITTGKGLAHYLQLFDLKQSEYWRTHLHFGKSTKVKVPEMGTEAKQLLVINTIIPLLVAVFSSANETRLPEAILDLLSGIPSEHNKIVRLWQNLGMASETAADSQALIEWYNQYCTQKRCLNCVIGQQLLAQK